MKKEKLAAREPQTFEQFIDAMMRDLHDGLLRGGANEMRGRLFIWLPYYTRWHKIVSAEAK